LIVGLYTLSGCTSVYNDELFIRSTTTLQVKVLSKDSTLFNRHKVHIGDGKQELGYMVNGEKKRVMSNKPLYITIEYYHAFSKIVKYKSFVLHTQSSRDYIILIKLRNQQNYIHLKEFNGKQLIDVDIDRIELR